MVAGSVLMLLAGCSVGFRVTPTMVMSPSLVQLGMDVSETEAVPTGGRRETMLFGGNVHANPQACVMVVPDVAGEITAAVTDGIDRVGGMVEGKPAKP